MPNTNPFSKLITNTFKKTFSNAINALLEEGAATIPCKLVYSGGKYETCSNCLINPVTKQSSGVYNGTGPYPFTISKCPYCLGEGKKEIKAEEIVHLMVIWDSKKWLPMASKVQTPESYAQTFCNINLMPKLKRAKEVYFNYRTEEDENTAIRINDYTHTKYIRDSEPENCGCCIGDDVFITIMWKKAG